MVVNMSTEPGFSWIPPSELERRIDTIPLPMKLKTSFTTRVIRWQSSSGSEWTVSRLKSFKDYLMQSYALGTVENQYKPEWFRTAPSGRLSGVFGTLTGIAMENSRSLKAVLFLVNIYTGVSRICSTPALLSEIKTEIQKKPVPIEFYSKVTEIKTTRLRCAFSRLSFTRVACGDPVPLTAVLPGKEGHAERISEDIISLAGTPLYTGDNKKLLDMALGSEITMMRASFSTLVGRIGITHESGLKTRYFAAPNQLVQRALEPLKDALLAYLKQLSWDCTLDQRRADIDISARLSSGQVVHSVDLSKATDNFPWEYQKIVLKYLVKGTKADRMRHLMESVVESGMWELPGENGVKWRRGQPLGLGPSFPLFTIAHGLLLFYLNGRKWNRDFYVLGDDVVIFNDALFAKYREVLARWDVKVSETKSFSSCNIAQFAGKTFTPTGSFWIPKWVPFTRDNLIDLEAWWYPGLTKGMPDHKLITWVLSLPPPYGVGRNPLGLPLDQRFSTEFVVETLLREQRREALGKPSATRIDLHSLINALTGLDDQSKYAMISMLMANQEILHPGGSLRVKNHPPTGGSLHELVPLMHGTEVHGYPYLRRKLGKLDRYTLGSLKMWKHIKSRVDSAKQKE